MCWFYAATLSLSAAATVNFAYSTLLELNVGGLLVITPQIVSEAA
jgi:hypothetical protein